MKVPDLILAAREDFLDDRRPPFQWSPEFLCRALNAAEQQAARRSYLLHDTDTAADGDDLPLCSLSVLASTASYAMSKKILRIDSIHLSELDYPLTQKTRGEMNAWISDWEELEGDPEVFIFENSSFSLQLVPEPPSSYAGDTAAIQVYRLPITDLVLTDKDSEPEIDEQYHYDLLHWVAHMAFMKPDSDTLNLPLAQFHEQQFTLKFGPLPTAKQERRRRSRSSNPTIRFRAFGF